MTYSINLHSSIVNPSKPKLEDKTVEQSQITLDIKLLHKLLEFSQQSVKDDSQLQEIKSNLIKLKNQGTLGLDHYDSIVALTKTTVDPELESILKLAGI